MTGSYSELGTMTSIFDASFHSLPLTTWPDKHCCPHFVAGETESQGGEMRSPESHGGLVTESKPEPRLLPSLCTVNFIDVGGETEAGKD